jgi:hypothetical protein
MTQLEKKFSDYQESECKPDLESEQVIDEKICPTCTPNPSFVLPSPWWELDYAYLNEEFCEYHVAISLGEKEKYGNVTTLSRGQWKQEYAIKKILNAFDKPINDAIVTELSNALYERENGIYVNQKKFLYAIPAFNFDQIEPNDSENAEKNNEDEELVTEVLVDKEGFLNKLFQIQGALRIFEIYYSSVQNTSESFVIRRSNDITQRINYGFARKNLNKFRVALNKALDRNGFPILGFTGAFRSQRVTRFKFVFKRDADPFTLKSIWVLPDSGCEEYVQLKGLRQNGETIPLTEKGMAQTYSFLNNLDEVINDLTAKETMPWLEWTLKHFYPTHVVDYGNIDELDESRAGLECLLEEQLGLGEGQVVDYLSKQMTSAFTFFEKETNRSACRNVNDQVSGGMVSQIEQADLRNSEVLADMKAEEVEKLTKKYKNKIEKALFEYLKTLKGDLKKKDIYKEFFNTNSKKITIANFKGDLEEKQVTIPIIEMQNSSGKKKISEVDVQLASIGLAVQIANDKFKVEGDYLDSNISPYKILAKEARREKIDKFNKGFKDGWVDFTNGNGEDGLQFGDIFSFFGLCGITKTAEKAMRCILNGVSYDDFLDMLIEKTIGFMETNTLNLLLNGLPYNFRVELDDAISKEFGPGVDLSSIFGVLNANGAQQKVKDITKTKKQAKHVVKIHQKLINGSKISEEENKQLKSYIGENWPAPASRIITSKLINYDKSLDDKGRITFDVAGPPIKEDSEKNWIKANKITPEKLAEKWAKYYITKHKKSTRGWSAAQERWISVTEAGSRDEAQSQRYEAAMNEYEIASKKFKETSLGVKVDAIFDIYLDFAIDYILSDLSADYLYELIQKYPAADFAFDAVLKTLKSPCPTAPLYHPPPDDFMKSLNVDLCNPTFQLQRPKLNIPSLSWRLGVRRAYSKVFKETLTRIIEDIMTNILTRVLGSLESALCNLAEAGVSGLIGIGDGFIDALNEAFCNDGENPETGRSKAEELADALFSPISFDPQGNFEGAGRKAANVIASVSSKNEVLEAMVAEPGEENPQFNRRISSAVKALAPEMESLLGSPNQVAYFFSNLGSYLTDDERERIRDLLDSGVPNLPVSDALCLTNEQLEDWNALREDLLSAYPNPRDIVRNLNEKALEELDTLMDIVGDLQGDGPFVGALQDEVLKDVCNKNNVLNDVSDSEVFTEDQDELLDAFFGNISNALIRGFSGKNGVIGNALRDKNGNLEFKRKFLRFFNPNYQNAQSERDNVYDEKSVVGRFLMDAITEGGQVNGDYPQTVGKYQREQILGEEGKVFDFDKNRLVFRYYEEFKPLIGLSQTFRKNVAAFKSSNPSSFDYRVSIREKENNKQPFREEIGFNTPIEIPEPEEAFLESFGFQYASNTEKDIRKEIFNQFVKSSLSTSGDFEDLYEKLYQTSTNSLVEAMMTGPTGEETIGHRFGYMEEDLTSDSFTYLNPEGGEYDKEESEKILGKFQSPRVIALDPGRYGGSYSSPPYYVEPRPFVGWLEIALKAFDGFEGCEPRNPPLISFGDIAQRTKMLNSSLRNSPKLTQDPDCVTVTPFDLLVDSKIKSKMDAVVRTTLRAYVAENFLQGYGLFSNVEILDKNFDSSLASYMAKKIKTEMLDLGPDASNRNIRIAKERYWYTFLEQCVESYQIMVDIDGIEPSDEVFDAKHKISLAQDAFVPVSRDIKRRMKNYLGDGKRIFRPENEDERIKIVSNGVKMGLHAAMFRISDQETRENWFNGKELTGLSKSDIKFASLKKLRFFQKIYFIRLYEKEATLIMSELLLQEIRRFSKLLVDGLYDKPQYHDIYKAFFGMKTFFPKSSSRVGFSSYYVDKQRDPSTSAGLVPSVANNLSQSPIDTDDGPKFIIESYVRMEARETDDTPPFIRNRGLAYTGAISLSKFNEFLSINSTALEDKSISDFFGNLSFTHRGSLKGLFSKGFTDNSSITRLVQLNLNEYEESTIPSLLAEYIAMRSFNDIDVIYDENFILDGETPEPNGTTGATGIKYGLRVSAVFPAGEYLNVEELRENNDLVSLSQTERAYLFDDDTFVLPLVSEEINVKDSKFSEIEQYDLECLINKMVKKPEFIVMFDKLFGFRQTMSMLGIYCIETFMPSLGQHEDERDEVDTDEPWEGVINKFGKNVLRREFKSLYLSRTRDGQSIDTGDSPFGNVIGLGDPFGSLKFPSIKVPWWSKRRMKTKVFDKNGQECADPKKDLR